jgi:hypothetical protein
MILYYPAAGAGRFTKIFPFLFAYNLLVCYKATVWKFLRESPVAGEVTICHMGIHRKSKTFQIILIL